MCHAYEVFHLLLYRNYPSVSAITTNYLWRRRRFFRGINIFGHILKHIMWGISPPQWNLEENSSQASIVSLSRTFRTPLESNLWPKLFVSLMWAPLTNWSIGERCSLLSERKGLGHGFGSERVGNAQLSETIPRLWWVLIWVSLRWVGLSHISSHIIFNIPMARSNISFMSIFNN